MRHVDAFGTGREGDLSGLLAEAGRWAGSLAGALGELEEQRLAGADPSGAVRAEVSGTGRLRALTIDPRGLRDLDHDQLAQAVQEAIVAAHQAMGDRLTEVVEELAGPAAAAGGGEDPLEAHVRDLLRGE
ncbi:MAG: hypothetical protein K0R62_7565 [Nonomuraea muscovyensis]|nr:hypothetical protein [Nonomuraea muscovyensis]